MSDKLTQTAPFRLRAVSRWISRAGRWRRFGLAATAGSVSVLAMAPFHVWPVLFITLPVLVWLLDGAARANTARAKVLTAAKDGWAFGFGYFFFGLFWIGEAFLVEAEVFGLLLPFAITLMPAGLAIFWGLATTAASLMWSANWLRVLVLALALSAAEWLRGHIFTGFPWNVLGYALTAPVELMQATSVIGIYGLTLIGVATFASPLVVLARADPNPPHDANWQRFAVAIVPAAVILISLYTYGAVRLSGGPIADVPGVKLRLVQPSTPQRDKWLPEKQGEIFQNHLDLSNTSPDGRRDDMADITHVIWPEAAMPFLPLSRPEALRQISDLLPQGKYLVSGALRVTQAETPNADIYSTEPGRRRAYNSLMVFGFGGGLVTLYDKIHLVPFGEYLPFQDVLEAIGLQQLTRVRGGFSIGRSPRQLMTIPGLPPVSPLICYEAIFPTAVVQGTARPGLLLNVTNDGWFGNTTGPPQHFHQSRVRAVEEGVPMVRVANNGISGLIDSLGRVVQRAELNKKTVIDTGLPAAMPPPIYARYGDLIFALLWVLVMMLALFFKSLIRVHPAFASRED